MVEKNSVVEIHTLFCRAPPVQNDTERGDIGNEKAPMRKIVIYVCFHPTPETLAICEIDSCTATVFRKPRNVIKCEDFET